MEKFNFQVVFKINDDNELVFVGSTKLTPGDLYYLLSSRVDKMTENNDKKCINFIYQPLKFNENAKEEPKER